MKFIKQFGIILFISFIGEILHYLIPLPVPASIYGVVLLFLCLEGRLIPVSAVRETGVFLVEIMPLMFIPAAVGLLDAWDVIRPAWIQYAAATLISTFTVMVVSGLVTQAVIHRSEKKGADQHG